MRPHHVPDAVPMLSPGRHRSPRKGACFMEMASFLAGERWSDHPACTHPALASLARLVNDFVSADGRRKLVTLIDQVIGLTGDDPRIDAHITLRSACTALPIASAERQNVLAVGILTCDRFLAQLNGAIELSVRSRTALAAAPAAEAWARRFVDQMRGSPSSLTPAAATTIREVAVRGIAEAAVGGADSRLIALLIDSIDEVRALTGSHSPGDQRRDARFRYARACASFDTGSFLALLRTARYSIGV